MKKKVILFVVAVLAVLGAQAQMIAYSVSTRVVGDPSAPTVIDLQGNYGKDLTGLMFDADGNVEYGPVESATGFPIGFNFRYNGQVMRYFLIGSDLTVQLSPTKYISTEVHMIKSTWFTDADIHDVIGMAPRFGVYGLDNTQISFWLEGQEEGYRALCIEYKNIDFQNGSGWGTEGDVCGAKATVQYRLYERDNNIEMKVKGFKPTDPGSYNYIRVGILGLSRDFVQVQSWDGSVVSASDNGIRYSKDNYPVDGQVYTFVAPEPCITPTSSGSNLELTSTSHQISGTFTVGNGDHYLVLATPEETISDYPVNRNRYEVGDKIGNAEVIAITDQGEFAGREGLPQGTYSIFIFAFNSLCMDGPLYSTDALFGTAKLKPGKPQSLGVTGSSKNSLTLRAVDNDIEMIIAMSEVQETNMYNQLLPTGVFGEPVGTYQVGDEIEGGGKVIYVGRTNAAINVSGLEAGKAYFFRAWSTDGIGNYSTDWLDKNAVTVAELPWELDFSTIPYGDIPIGWTADGNENSTWANVSADYIYNSVSSVPGSEPVECWLQTSDIYLDEGSNWLSIEIGANKRTPWAGDWTMEDGDEIAIQLTTDGLEYTDILILNKNNMPEYTDESGTVNIWKNDEFTTFTVNFTEYAGQKVKVCLSVKRHTKGEVRFRNFRIDGTLYGIVGNIPGLSQEDDLFMTQDKNDKNLYTASLDVDVTAIPANAYEYKMRSNMSWDGYQIPSYGFQRWKPESTGPHRLVFTANIATSVLSLDVQHPYEVSFKNEARWTDVYAFAFGYDENGNLVEYSGAWPGTKVEVSGGFSRKWIYTFYAEQEPQYIVWSNGDGHPEYEEGAEQTSEQPFVNGKAYSYYPEITSIKLPGSYNNWDAPEMLPGGNDNLWETTLAVANDAEFKLLVNGDNWIGYDDVVIDAPDGWLERGTDNSFRLKHSVAWKEAYYIVVWWSSPSFDVTSGWYIAIEEGNPDAIKSVRADAAQEKIVHNLAGQRLEKERRGVNIVGGQKVAKK